MGLFIGIDSGGTKTEGILADSDGNIFDRVCCKGGNPMDSGLDAAREEILLCIHKLEENADDEILSVYAGIAGANHVDMDMDGLISRSVNVPIVVIDDDRRITVSGTLGRRDGCGLICGTGSSLSIIKEAMPIRQIGGLGYLIDTGGSGFELGQAALKQSFRYLDGRGPYTVLAELIREKLGKDPWDAFADIYNGGRAFIASLACVVFKGMEMGDKISAMIVESGANALSELTIAAEDAFCGSFPVVMTGGIFATYPKYAELVKKKCSPKAEMITASSPPVYGALVEAMFRYGICATAETRDNFIKQYYCSSVRRG